MSPSRTLAGRIVAFARYQGVRPDNLEAGSNTNMCDRISIRMSNRISIRLVLIFVFVIVLVLLL